VIVCSAEVFYITNRTCDKIGYVTVKKVKTLGLLHYAVRSSFLFVAHISEDNFVNVLRSYIITLYFLSVQCAYVRYVSVFIVNCL